MNIIIYILLFTAFLSLLIKNNFLLFFISLELIVLAINLNFIFCSLELNDALGLYISILLLTLAAIDTALGLSLLIKYYNLTLITNLQISTLTLLKG